MVVKETELPEFKSQLCCILPMLFNFSRLQNGDDSADLMGLSWGREGGDLC